MADPILISIEDLSHRLGAPDAPVLIDARTDQDFAADPRLIPGARRRPGLGAAGWAAEHAGQAVVVACQRGLKISQGAAAWLGQAGARARALDGGHVAWRDAGLPLVPEDRLPPRDAAGRTHWAVAAGPGVEAVAGAWLVRRFVDARAVLLPVEPDQVAAVAERFAARPLAHAPGAFAALCADLALATPALGRFAELVAGDAPEAPGFRAGLAGRMALASDATAGLEAGLSLCDGFYRWCGDRGEGAEA